MSDNTSPLQQFGGPRVDPRFRRRWAEARRAEGRRRLKILLCVMTLVALVGGGIGLLYTPVFRVRHIVVIGDLHTPRPQLLAAAGLSTRDGTVLMVDAGPPSAQRALDALPWVAAATFQRRWPWTVVIRVTERSPVARLVADGHQDVVDRSGRVLEVSPRALPILPVIVGAQGAPAGAYISPSAGLSGLELGELLAAAGAAPHSLARRNLKLAYSAAAGLIGYLGREKAVVLLGDATNLGSKLAILEELATRVNLAGYAQVDLTVPQRPALTPLPSAVLGVG